MSDDFWAGVRVANLGWGALIAVGGLTWNFLVAASH